MPSVWNLVYDSDTAADFAATRSAVGAGAVLVNGITDQHGGVLTTASGKLSVSLDATGAFARDLALRPGAEDDINQRVIGYFHGGDIPSGGTIWLGTRWFSSRAPYSSSFLGGQWSTGGNLIGFQKVYNAGGGAVGLGVNASTSAIDTTHDYRLTLDATGTNPTTLTLTLHDMTTGTDLATETTTESESQFQLAGNVAWTFDGSSGLAGKFTRIQRFSQIAITPPVISLTSFAQREVGLSATAAVGETGTYQWHRSRTAGFTASAATALAGQTGFVLNDTNLTPGTAYYYQIIFTDGSGNAVSSGQFVVRTQEAFGSNVLRLGAIGDSISVQTDSHGVSTMQAAANAVKALRPSMTVLLTNTAIPGTLTSNWVPGANLTNAMTVMAAAGVRLVTLNLGVNDAKSASIVSAATYLANMQAITAALTAAGFVVMVGYPSYVDYTTGTGATAWTSASDTALQGYQAQIDSLIDGVGVVRGETGAYANFAANPSHLIDGVHPNDTGVVDWGSLWSAAIYKWVSATTPTSLADTDAVSRPDAIAAAELAAMAQVSVTTRLPFGTGNPYTVFYKGLPQAVQLGTTQMVPQYVADQLTAQGLRTA